MLVRRSVSVPLGAADAFSRISSLDSIAGCLPTATVTQRDGTAYQGELSVTIGPVTTRFSGTATLVELDPVERRLVVRAFGRAGGNRAVVDASVTIASVEQPGGNSRLDICSDIRLRGSAAHLGRGAVDGIVEALIDQFAVTMAGSVPRQAAVADAVIDAPDPPAPVTRRLARSSLSGLVIAVACGALLGGILTRRRYRGAR